MLDVHSPHHTPHTWRDFIIHIATICVGLLIAVGLEQAVEAINRHHERGDLRESLAHENEQILHDTERVENSDTKQIEWFHSVEAQLSNAVQAHHPVGKIAERPAQDLDLPDDPYFKAAKFNARAALLSEEETVAYGELDSILASAHAAYERRQIAGNKINANFHKLAFGKSRPALQSRTTDTAADTVTRTAEVGELDRLAPSTEDLKLLYADLVDFEVSYTSFRSWCREARGAATAMSHGERDLRKIEASEHTFLSKP